MRRVKRRETRVESRNLDCGLRSHFAPRSSLLAPRSSRRGVLLLVVLSMLVLFMLIGTAFLMTSNQANTAAKASAKKDRLGNHGTRLLDRALMQFLRDTRNPKSVVRTHSLLRDYYGTADGFQGMIYSPPSPLTATTAPTVTRFAGGTADDDPTTPIREELGPTQGQFIDIYVRSLAWNLNDPLTPDPIREDSSGGERALTQPDLRHVLKLEPDIQGKPQIHVLPLTRGYYNGCLMTIKNGAAAGQSARIVDYEYIGDIAPTQLTPSPGQYTRLYRFRVMGFPRADGQPLQIDLARSPEIKDLAGATFIVNGRPYSGAGAGYNVFATTGAPKLTALTRFVWNYEEPWLVDGELALLPNSIYFDPERVFGSIEAVPNPFEIGETKGITLNRSTYTHYSDFVGPGDADESYDAADFQNMFLALQTVSPRAQGRVVHSNGDGPPLYLDPNNPIAFSRNADFLRYDLEDVPMPSFHRPDLVNFWYHRLLYWLINDPNGLSLDRAVRAIMQPFDENSRPNFGLSPAQAAMIVEVKRRILMRPSHDDHPKFNGSNTQSLPADLAGITPLVVPENTPRTISIPYWEVLGPWDVDNDNDGVPDSVWLDLGDPVIELEDGTRVKALYAPLIIDLDSRLNVNAHGLADHINPANLALKRDPTNGSPIGVDNLAGSRFADPAYRYSTDDMPQGIGYGPAEISLRPIFPTPWSNINGTLDTRANRDDRLWPVDSYASLLVGRLRTDVNDNLVTSTAGKYGFAAFQSAQKKATSGMNYDYSAPGWADATRPTGDTAQPDLAAQLKFFEYPWVGERYAFSVFPNIRFGPPTAFGNPPDLMGRYGIGLDYTGQPVVEQLYDTNAATQSMPIRQWRPNHLLVNSPYELNLNNAQRRDTWTTSMNFIDATAEFSTSLSQNDDAPFATADLERVLRAWDADSGTLPSRLWDVVNDFDPLKLMSFDPYRTLSITNDVFDPVNRSLTDADPEFLTTAQQMAAVNRRLATTDSYGPPVPGGSLPNQTILALGADGQPGRAGFNDDSASDSLVDEIDELNSSNSDDFKTLFGKDVAQATIFDLLRYRVWQTTRQWVMSRGGPTFTTGPFPYTETSLAGLNANNYTAFLIDVSQLAEARINGEAYPDSNGNGIYDLADPATGFQDINANGFYDPPLAQLLAPELVAGKRMDVNRPLGDGRDNGDGLDNDNNGYVDDSMKEARLEDDNGRPIEKPDRFINGVVDDPLEAGEPFLDANGNGKWDAGEPFLDLMDGDADYDGFDYDGPRDRLWKGLVDEGSGVDYAEFDYTNGEGVAVYKGRGLKVRNLESQGRQLQARHLYCLMLLLVDENYIAPWDEMDPQILTWMDTTKKALVTALKQAPYNMTDVAADARADFLVKRKLTCRTIAQWAINCVDMRDPDVIMTPFEYDENPWDGWGVPDGALVNIPLDGDPATDENKGEVIDWDRATAANGYKKVIAPSPTGVVPAIPARVTAMPLLPEQTRGVVWGAERPELLITETLAFHDRRTENKKGDDDGSHDEIPHLASTRNRYQDPDLDQGLRPRGSLFVEVHNPWTPDGQLPAELYSLIDSEKGTIVDRNGDGFFDDRDMMGVELGRLSNLAADANGKLLYGKTNAGNEVKRSPVWRMIAVEEWRKYRNNDKIDDTRLDVVEKSAQPKTYPDNSSGVWQPSEAEPNSPFRPTNPDFDVAFDAGRVPTEKTGANLFNRFEVDFPYIEREFYFTTDKSAITRPQRGVPQDWDFSNNKFKLRIPDRSVRIGGFGGPLVRVQKFIPWQLETASATEPAIAPIKPGRYGVIGSAGTKYLPPKAPVAMSNFYTTTVGRAPLSGQSAQADQNLAPHHTRRIELHPNKNPDIQQLLVANNGGDPKDDKKPGTATSTANPDFATVEIGRDNELIFNRYTVDRTKYPSEVENIYDRDKDGKPDAEIYHPCVAIPVDGMNVSEPPWGWQPREEEVVRIEERRAGPGENRTRYEFNESLAGGEGRYAVTSGSNTDKEYDVPFNGPDANGNMIDPELCRTGTTPNYRTIHLQRLANPLLPWNPEPKLSNGKADPEHRPNLPINPYRTVDSSSVNLTAFNGIDNESIQNWPLQLRPWIVGGGSGGGPGGGGSQNEQAEYLKNLGNNSQIWYFRSLERGFWARMNPIGIMTKPTPVTPPQRALWAQEPAMMNFKKPGGDIYDLVAGMQMTMWGRDIPDNVKSDHDYQNNAVDMVMEHSLGFGNESYGLLYDKQGTRRPGFPPFSITDSRYPTEAAIGAPAPMPIVSAPRVPGGQIGGFVWDKGTPPTPVPVRVPVDGTHPWLQWANRPFVSAEEVLNVPATSSSEMLRQYTTIGINTLFNPYDGTGYDPTATPPEPVPNMVRFAGTNSPFGHLLNFALTSLEPAASGNVMIDTNGDGIEEPQLRYVGAPHFYRILDFIQVPSRYVGTETMLNAETFNDSRSIPDPLVDDIKGPSDPRYNFQPPFNRVSREHDPGKVNINTMTSRRIPGSWPETPGTWDPDTSPADEMPPRIWSEVFDGIMQRVRDGNSANPKQLGHLGPAWRDVVMSRKGYVQFNADGTGPMEKFGGADAKTFPDVNEFGLNQNFPSVFANPFRSPNAGDFVPLVQMMHFGIDASMLRRHHFNRGVDLPPSPDNSVWGSAVIDDDKNGAFEDTREAGFANDQPAFDSNTGAWLGATSNTIAFGIPLFSETFNAPYIDGERNPYYYYQPMARLGNLLTERSGVFAIWITVGYFEVEPALGWNDTGDRNNNGIADNEEIRTRFGATLNDNDPATVHGLSLYNRVYPEGYQLGKEVGSDTGDVQRPRGFYIIDRTEEVGFKPGEDLNVERTIRLKRRIE